MSRSSPNSETSEEATKYEYAYFLSPSTDGTREKQDKQNTTMRYIVVILNSIYITTDRLFFFDRIGVQRSVI